MASQEHDRETAGDQPPLWGYVTKLEKLSGTGGGWSFKCNFCSETRKGSYYRVRAHLIGEKDLCRTRILNFRFFPFLVPVLYPYPIPVSVSVQPRLPVGDTSTNLEPHRLLQAADKTLKTMAIEFAEYYVKLV
ncbi:hypothetical protein LXL04_004782 [Taraxacum kok-saghyz]